MYRRVYMYIYVCFVYMYIVRLGLYLPYKNNNKDRIRMSAQRLIIFPSYGKHIVDSLLARRI